MHITKPENESTISMEEWPITWFAGIIFMPSLLVYTPK